nr:MAG TPA: hypothetical protein [Caudoviricetes sp.]
MRDIMNIMFLCRFYKLILQVFSNWCMQNT